MTAPHDMDPVRLEWFLNITNGTGGGDYRITIVSVYESIPDEL